MDEHEALASQQQRTVSHQGRLTSYVLFACVSTATGAAVMGYGHTYLIHIKLPRVVDLLTDMVQIKIPIWAVLQQDAVQEGIRQPEAMHCHLK